MHAAEEVTLKHLGFNSFLFHALTHHLTDTVQRQDDRSLEFRFGVRDCDRYRGSTRVFEKPAFSFEIVL